jgi:uncharacterized repeat protein (TIGR03803 family)
MTKTVQSLGTRLRAARIAFGLAVVLVPAVAARAQTFKVLYNFTGGADGGYPYANLIQDAKGNLYGTTSAGGPSGVGTVFKVDKTGKETVLYSFTGGADGGYPFAGLIQDPSGLLYGTTDSGGTSSYGTVFKVAPKTGKETVLYSFTGSGGDGEYPNAGLLRDNKGNLYGTNEWAGASGYGTVFKVGKTGKETVLHGFGGSDGAYPFAGLVRDSKGNLYGYTAGGGTYSAGTVFMVDDTGTETVLWNFSGGADGGYPFYGYLVRDSKGNLYGTTEGGGASGYGTVYKLTPAGKESVLYSFTGTGGDGGWPYAGVVRDASGNLYGTTDVGGASGYGTVFMVGKTGKETVLHSFDYSDGESPFAGLLRDAKGNLYGTTYLGGASGYGVVFEVTP